MYIYIYIYIYLAFIEEISEIADNHIPLKHNMSKRVS